MSIASILNAQITDENGVSAVGTFNQTLTGKIGIGTSNPTTELDVNGVLTANVGFFNNSLPDGVTFVDVTDRNTKTKQLGLGQGPNNSSLLNFFDFPESNFDSQARVYLGLHDRSGNLRWRFQASEEGSSYFHHFDRNQSTTFQFSEHTNDNVFLRLPKANSYVSIGTTSFNDNGDLYKLTVNGKMRAHAVKVYTDWADFVFEKDYKLPTLKEVEQYIQDNGHLIDIPSAKEVEENGIDIGEMNKLLLQKIEELTLYTIQLKKEIDELKRQKNEK